MAALTERRRGLWLPILLGVVLVGLTAVLLYRGWSFYALSLEDRVEHPEFRRLRPSGVIGNGYGWVASVLVVLNLSYLVRRRLAGTRLGSMRVWLDIHVFTGMAAAILVTFHSAFQLRTPVATMSAASLAVVVATGLIGRFLYALTPGNARERLRNALDEVELRWPGQRTAFATALEALPAPAIPTNASLLRSVLAIPRWRRVSKKRREALDLIAPPRAQRDRPLRAAISELRGAAAAEARASGMAALVRSWRGFHRFFALLMLASVLLHAGIAWYYGYRWIFAS